MPITPKIPCACGTNAFVTKTGRCKRCSNKANRKLRKDAIAQRTPKWLSADQLAEIDAVHSLANEMRPFMPGVVVDHIVPLRGRNVSGLNVPWNLQIIPKEDNTEKSNTYPHRFCF